MKHTRGPWAFQKFGPHYCLTAQHGKRDIILASDGCDLIMSNDRILKPIDINHPNAKLISAAPDLLEALENCAELLSLFAVKLGIQVEGAPLKSDAESYGVNDLLANARQAIKKATE